MITPHFSANFVLKNDNLESAWCVPRESVCLKPLSSGAIARAQLGAIQPA